ncbi:MAG: hypothetical protein GC129_03740 [Proteobacteria bacterium]|nr:hypothetical protein [Pseudomonadota bacterium]
MRVFLVAVGLAFLLLPNVSKAEEFGCIIYNASGGCASATMPQATDRSLSNNQKLLSIKPRGKALVKDALYIVDLRCGPVRYDSVNNPWGLFVEKNRVTSHIVAITKQRLSSKELPKDARAAVTVFSVTDGVQTKDTFINKGCRNTFVLSGRDPVFLAATANQTSTNKPGPVTNILFGLVKIALSVGPLFHGTTFESHWQNEFKAASDNQPTVGNIFTQFDRGETVTESSDLFEGKTTVNTPYSTVTVTISRIKSLVELGNDRFTSDFEATVEGAKAQLKLDTLTGAALASQCGGFAADLLARNLGATDVAYALGYASSLFALDRDKTLTCVGSDYALPALNHKAMWDKLHPGKGAPYDANDVESKFAGGDIPKPAQPDYSAIKDNPLQRLQNALGGYLKGFAENSAPNFAAATRYFAASVHVEDFSGTLGFEDEPMAPQVFGTALAKVATRVGCATSDTEAVAVFFAFKAPSGDGGKYRVTDALAIRVWLGKGRKVIWAKVTSDDAPGLLERALQARNSRICGTVEVAKAAAGT